MWTIPGAPLESGCCSDYSGRQSSSFCMCKRVKVQGPMLWQYVAVATARFFPRAADMYAFWNSEYLSIILWSLLKYKLYVFFFFHLTTFLWIYLDFPRDIFTLSNSWSEPWIFCSLSCISSQKSKRLSPKGFLLTAEGHQWLRSLIPYLGTITHNCIHL